MNRSAAGRSCLTSYAFGEQPLRLHGGDKPPLLDLFDDFEAHLTGGAGNDLEAGFVSA